MCEFLVLEHILKDCRNKMLYAWVPHLSTKWGTLPRTINILAVPVSNAAVVLIPNVTQSDPLDRLPTTQTLVESTDQPLL